MQDGKYWRKITKIYDKRKRIGEFYSFFITKPCCLQYIDNKKETLLGLFCTPAGVRTLDPLIKSQMLYQLSYKRILFVFAVAKVRTLFCSAKLFPYFFGIC